MYLSLPLTASPASFRSQSRSINFSWRTLALTLAGIVLGLTTADGGVLINEIMFHPAGLPEPTPQEWIELLNPDAVAANVAGWQFTMAWSLPFQRTPPFLPAVTWWWPPTRGHFMTAHPGFTGALVGGWDGPAFEFRRAHSDQGRVGNQSR
jgi:hypothetical protein